MATSKSRSSTKNNSAEQSKSKVTVLSLIRDVLLASINRGVFIPAAAWSCIFLLLIKLPGKDAAQLIRDVLEKFKQNNLTGWILFVSCLGCWVWSNNRLKKKHSEEMKRVAKEKSDMQSASLGKQLASSSGAIS